MEEALARSQLRPGTGQTRRRHGHGPVPILPRAERGAARFSFVVHFAEVEVDVETGHVRVTRYQAAHDSGRIMNPLTATSQVQGGSIQGLGMALHEELLYDRRSGLPLTAGYYGARL